MKNYIENLIRNLDPVNAEYILLDGRVMGKFENAERYLRKGEKMLALDEWKRGKRLAAAYGGTHLTPASIRPGDGVTVKLWTDQYAATVEKVTRRTVTVRRDKATLDPNFKPEFISGGFAAHCTNQSEQSYTYLPDRDGEVYKFHWSNKYSRYGQPGNLILVKGRHEFYDYNF